MTATLVDDALTPLTEEGLVAAVIGGYRKVLNSEPSPESASILAGQGFLETGRGKKVHKNNPGNKKKPADWDGFFCRFTCDELFDDASTARAKKLGPTSVSLWKGGPLHRVVLYPPHPWSEFVAFETADEGFADWLLLHTCSERYRKSWSRIYAGDAYGAVVELGKAGYFTADVSTYAKAVVSIAKSLLPVCQRLLAGDEHGLTEEYRERIRSMVSESLTDSLVWMPDRHELQVAA